MTRSRVTCAVFISVAVLAAACGDDGASTSEPAGTTTTSGSEVATTTTSTTTTAPAASITPAYAEKGPYEVGVTTITLADGRQVEVYYPASDDAADVADPATYSTGDALDEDLLALVPADVDLTVAIDGYRDAPPSPDGPFPLLMFSHGFGGFRNIQSVLTAGIASHGIVVASIDHVERGLLAVASGTVERDRERDVAIVLEARDAVVAEFPDVIDTERQAAAGHSAGGGTVLGLTAADGFDSVIGWAAGGSSVDSGIPTMLVVAETDIGVPPDEVRPIYDELPAPKAFVNVLGAGHNSFTDTCANVVGGQDLLQIAVDIGFPIPDDLMALAVNGCEPGALPPDLAFEPIQHFTVAWVLEHTGSDVDPTALDEAVADEFEAGVEYEQAAA